MDTTTIAALATWTGLHTLLMLGLALNVTRHRLRAGAEGSNPEVLDKAIRAHGNNIEYVPIILFGIALLALLGIGATLVHALCAILFLARCLHAYGIQQFGALPKSRVIGNVGTWVVMLVTTGMLVYKGLA